MKTQTKGLVIGKFYPPHKGHSYLIETALEHANTVDVLVCDHPAYRIPAIIRAAWLNTLHPAANIKIIDDIEQDDNSEAWAVHTMNFLGYAPDIVFSSEAYGKPYATLMGAKHHMVDRQRRKVPISARQIRPNVHARWEFLEPAVRAHFATRICILGAESTGTTTIARALAAHHNAPWVPEYGRHYTEAFINGKSNWESSEFIHIARMQQQMEQAIAGHSDGLVFCDTNAFATRLWHERYMGYMSPEVDTIARHDQVSLYIITDVDIPFVQDGIRDGEAIRHRMHQCFIDEVKATQVPYIIAKGTLEQRLAHTIPIVTRVIQEKVVI